MATKPMSDPTDVVTCLRECIEVERNRMVPNHGAIYWMGRAAVEIERLRGLIPTTPKGVL